MNSFGRIFRLSIFGESHGNGVGVLLDGVRAGIDLLDTDFTDFLERRAPSRKFETSRKEKDIVSILSGVLNGKTTGAPLMLFVKNEDVDSSYYEAFQKEPRDGHADYTAKIKYRGFNDYRGGGTFSGRMTLAFVLAGVVAQKVLEDMAYKINIKADVYSVAGRASYDMHNIPEDKNFGGVIKTQIEGLPVGLGEPFFDSFESVIAHLAFSIPGVKGIDFDNIVEKMSLDSKDFNKNTAINGGITNGKTVFYNLYLKGPASRVKEGRFDRSFLFRTPVIAESIAWIALLDFVLLRKAEV